MAIKLITLLHTMRLPFLILAPICVFLGLAISVASDLPINNLQVALLMLGALSAHVSVNTLNEYYDFKSGLDLITNKTAFSGGSGALPDNPEMAGFIRLFGLASLMLTIMIGLYFINLSGPKIVPIGLLGVIIVITYTQWLNRSPFICLIVPGLGFGVLMVVGTHVILSGEYSGQTVLLSLVPFFLNNNLLLLNQYPDVKADASVGRNTFPIAFGYQKSNFVYAVFFMAAYLIILSLIIYGYIPVLCVTALLPVLLSLFTLSGMIRHTSKIGDFPQYLAANVAATILTPLLLGIAIMYG